MPAISSLSALPFSRFLHLGGPKRRQHVRWVGNREKKGPQNGTRGKIALVQTHPQISLSLAQACAHARSVPSHSSCDSHNGKNFLIVNVAHDHKTLSKRALTIKCWFIVQLSFQPSFLSDRGRRHSQLLSARFNRNFLAGMVHWFVHAYKANGTHDLMKTLLGNCLNSADVPRKNSSVWRAHHCYLRFVLDPEENPFVPLRFTWDLSLGLLQVRHLF